jgi:WD40 repeat protein
MNVSTLPGSDLHVFPSGDVNCPVVHVFGGRPFNTDGELLALAFGSDPNKLWSVEDPGVLRCWDLAADHQVSWKQLDVAAMVWGFSGDGKLLAGASDELSLWDVASGENIWVLPQPTWVNAVAFSPDNELVATGHDDGTVRLWTTADRELVCEWTAHQKPLSAVAFGADGRRLATAGESKRIHLWDVAQPPQGEPSPGPRRLGTLTGHTDRVPALAWHPDGRRFYSAGWDTTARVWDTTTCEPIILLNSHATQVFALAMSRDGERLACADSGSAVHLWRLADNKTVWALREHEGEVRCLAFSPDGLKLASGGTDRLIRVFDSRLPEPSWQPATPTAAVRVAQEPDEPAVIVNPPEPRGGLALSPDGRRVVTTAEKSLRVWDAASGQMVGQLESSMVLQSAVFSPDGKLIAAGTCDGPIQVWDAATGRQHNTLDGQTVPITSLALAPRSPFAGTAALVASASCRGQDVWLWDIDKGEPVLLVPDAVDGCAVEGLAFHPEGRLLAVAGVDWLATGGSDGGLTVWDVVGRHPVANLPLGSAAVAFHPGGERLALASLVYTIRLYDLPRREVVFELAGHEDLVTCVAFSPDGRWLATAGLDRTARLWDATTGRAAGGVSLDSQVRGLSFSPDGQVVYTANVNGSSYKLEVQRLLKR